MLWKRYFLPGRGCTFTLWARSAVPAIFSGNEIRDVDRHFNCGSYLISGWVIEITKTDEKVNQLCTRVGSVFDNFWTSPTGRANRIFVHFGNFVSISQAYMMRSLTVAERL